MKINPLIFQIRKHAKESGISRVLVALSGGADSITSSYALLEAGIQITALHCNFHLRGEESDRDQLFVKEFCDSHNISLCVKNFDVESYVSHNKSTSVEMACRELRYAWFEDKLRETGYHRLVTGHNADDNIETLFLNLLRGSGTRGLKGMTADNGKIWRPLLAMHKKDILDFIRINGLQYITDSSNLKNDYRRNFLRNEIIPLFRSEWKGFDKALDSSIRYITEENKIVENSVDYALRLSQSGLPLPTTEILTAPSPLLLIRRYIEIAGPLPTSAFEILEAIKANKPHSRNWKLKNGNVILRGGKLSVIMSHCE